MPTVREAAFRVFDHFGVDRLFGNPGSTELPMLKALPEGFRYVLGLNEAVVVGMADGFARSSGKPALVNLHSSAGTGHSLGNLFTAFKNNTPLVVMMIPVVSEPPLSTNSTRWPVLRNVWSHSVPSIVHAPCSSSSVAASAG